MGKWWRSLDGVRKVTSKRGGSLEPFSLIRAQIIESRGSLETLAEVKIISGNYPWQKYLGRVTLAYQLCESIDKLTEEGQPHPQVFNILVLALSSLGSLGNNWETSVKNWLVEILTELGYWSDDKEFKGDIWNYIEDISEKQINSSKMLEKIKNSKSF